MKKLSNERRSSSVNPKKRKAKEANIGNAELDEEPPKKQLKRDSGEHEPRRSLRI